MSHSIPWTFKTWIAEFDNVDLPIGDLAHDILRDPDFPEEDHFGTIHEHLYAKAGGNPAVMEAFTCAWSYYLATR